MVKATISNKRRKSSGRIQKMKAKSNLKLKKNAKVSGYSATERLLDETFIAQAVWECLKNNDPQGVIEIIETHLEVVVNKNFGKAGQLLRMTTLFWIQKHIHG